MERAETTPPVQESGSDLERVTAEALDPRFGFGALREEAR